MPKQGKTPKKKSKEKTPQKSGESEYPAMDQEELNRLVQNAIEQSQAQLQQKHEEQIKRLEADREALEERLTRKFEDEVRELNRAFEESTALYSFPTDHVHSHSGSSKQRLLVTCFAHSKYTRRFSSV